MSCKTVCPLLPVRWLALHCASEGCFSIRRVEVKRLSSFPLRRCVTSFAGSCFSAGSALGRRLDGDQKNEAEQPRTRPDRCDATGTATLANSPHSSSREGRSFHRLVESYWGDPCHARSAIMFHLRVWPSPTWFRLGRRAQWSVKGGRRSARRDLPLTGPLRAPAGCNGRAHNQAAFGMMSCRVQRNSVPSRHMRCMITASRRANATIAFCRPRRLATFIAHALSHDHFVMRISRVCAAS